MNMIELMSCINDEVTRAANALVPAVRQFDSRELRYLLEPYGQMPFLSKDVDLDRCRKHRRLPKRRNGFSWVAILAADPASQSL